jgi:hypothetical protein
MMAHDPTTQGFAATSEPDVGRPIVLIVDDHADIRRLLSISLARECRVLEAENGAAALDAVRRHHPHVVLLVATVSESVANDEALRGWALGAFDVIEGASGAVVSATPHEVIGLLPVTTSIRAATALRLAFGGDPDALHVGLGIGRFDDPIHELHTRARYVAALPGARIAISVARRGVVEARELLDDARLGAEPTFHVTRVAEMFEEAADRSGQARWGGVTAIRGVRGGPEGLRHGPAALPGRDGR